MLTIDPRTGAVTQGGSGRGTAILVAAVVLATGGGSVLLPAMLRESDACRCESESDFDTTLELQEVELTDDLLIDEATEARLAVTNPLPARNLRDPGEIEAPFFVQEVDDDGSSAEGAEGADTLETENAPCTAATVDEGVSEGSGASEALLVTDARPLPMVISRSAARLDGLWSCLSKEYSRARDAWERVDETDRAQLREVCLRHGVVLP